MAENEIPPSQKFVDAANSVGRFINEAYMFNRRVRIEAKESKTRTGGKWKGNLPVGVWCTLARWDKAYQDAWTELGKIRELLAVRWGESRLWIDQSRGAIYILTIPFLTYALYPDAVQAIRSAYKSLLDIDEKYAEEDRRIQGVSAEVAARLQGTGEGILFDSKWQESHAAHTQICRQIGEEQSQVVNLMQGNPLALNIRATVRVHGWSRDFLRRLTAVERVASTLVAAAADQTALPLANDSSYKSIPYYIDLDQASVLANRNKRTLERWLKDGKLPPPTIRGSKGVKSEWLWSNLRDPLSKVSRRILPEVPHHYSR